MSTHKPICGPDVRPGGAGAGVRALAAAGLLVLSLLAVVSTATAGSLEDALVRMLKDSPAFQLLVQEVMKEDSERRQMREMLAPWVSVEGHYTEQRIPATGMAAFFGTEQYQWDVTSAVRKMFMTGTTVTLALSESLFDANDPAFGDPMIGLYKPEDPPLHTPLLSVTIEQELLKNAFGYGTKRMDRALGNVGVIKRRTLKARASDLALKVLADYWQVKIDVSALGFARDELAESRRLLKIAKENIRYGKSESHNLNQFRAMVGMSEVKVARAEQSLTDSKRLFKRETHADPDDEFEGVTDLVDVSPRLDREEAVKTALARRADYLNSGVELEMARINLERERNAALPALSIFGSAASLANRELFGDAVGDVGRWKYPNWNVGFRVTYPVFNPGVKARVRDAWLAHEQAKVNRGRIEEEVRDDVLSKLERVGVARLGLEKARSARDELEGYYAALVKKSRQGKLGAFELKQALDGLTEARQGAYQALVGFNLSLLAYKRAREELFEHYGVTLDNLIAKAGR